MKKAIIFLSLIFIFKLSFSQVLKDGKHEFFFGAGTSTYQGQIGSQYNGLTKDNIFAIYQNTMSEAFCIGYRFKPEYYPFRISGILGYNKLSATNPSTYETFSSYSFSTNLFELGVNGEIGFHLKKLLGSKRGNTIRSGSLRYKLPGPFIYLKAGIGLLYAKPNAKEVMAKDYRYRDRSFVALSFPVGAGIRYDINQYIFISLETSISFTSSSYLDGLKTITESRKDSYHNNFITIGYKLPRKK